MAGFRQIFMTFFMEFINIGPVYIRGWVGGVQGWGEWWQKLNQRRKKTQIVEFRVANDVYMHPQRGNIPLQGLDRCALTVHGNHIRCPQPTWSPPLTPFHQLYIYMVGKKHSGKADQSTLASGRNEHALLFSVAISWGNKMNFSLCAKMSAFCSDSHIFHGQLVIHKILSFKFHCQ